MSVFDALLPLGQQRLNLFDRGRLGRRNEIAAYTAASAVLVTTAVGVFVGQRACGSRSSSGEAATAAAPSIP